MPKHLSQLILFLLIISGLTFIILGQLPAHSIFWREMHNTGHIIGFGSLSIITLLFVRSTDWGKISNQAIVYLVVMLTNLFAGIAVEFIQLAIGRDAEFIDVLHDVLGTLSFLGIYAWYDPLIKTYRNKVGRRIFITITGLSLLLLFTGLSPVFNLVSAYYHRDAAFPVLIDFDKRWPQLFIFTQDASLTITSAPKNLAFNAGLPIGKLTLNPAKYPALGLKEPVSDWSGYSYLSFYILSETTRSFNLSLRINDRQHNQQYNDRFNTVFEVQYGMNRVQIPLTKVRHSPASRELDMQAIDQLVLFAIEPQQPIQIYIGNFFLE